VIGVYRHSPFCQAELLTSLSHTSRLRSYSSILDTYVDVQVRSLEWHLCPSLQFCATGSFTQACLWDCFAQSGPATRHGWRSGWASVASGGKVFLKLGTRWGERSALRPGRALPPGKEPPVPIVQGVGWAPEPVWTQRVERKILCPCRGSNPGRPVRSQTLYWPSYPAQNKHKLTGVGVDCSTSSYIFCNTHRQHNEGDGRPGFDYRRQNAPEGFTRPLTQQIPAAGVGFPRQASRRSASSLTGSRRLPAPHLTTFADVASPLASVFCVILKFPFTWSEILYRRPGDRRRGAIIVSYATTTLVLAWLLSFFWLRGRRCVDNDVIVLFLPAERSSFGSVVPSFRADENIFTGTQTQDRIRVCGLWPCNLLVETKKLWSCRRSSIGSGLEKPPSQELKPKIIFRSFTFLK
jgi:hypothetical protein